MNPLNFKLYSRKSELGLIKIALKQIQSDVVTYKISQETDINLKRNDIPIIFIEKLDDEILNSALRENKATDNPFIILTESEDILIAATLAKLGFNQIFVIPYELQKFKEYLTKCVENHLQRINLAQEKSSSENVDFSGIIGNSDTLNETFNYAKKSAENPDVNILILGETGTGKDLLARTIHENSSRANSPFIDIICTAIPASLLEAELFGYEKGAFTDARNRKKGLFELAEDGTIFLDEIGDLTLELQAKLLKAIDNRVIRRLGGTKDIKIDARIISATNRNLEELVKKDQFRLDLYHRLNVISITMPPLRERDDDVFLLTEYFTKEYAEKFRKKIDKMEPKLIEYLKSYHWPGNIRELKNAIERAVLLAEDDTLRLKHLFNVLKKGEAKSKGAKIKLEVDFEQTNLSALQKQFATEVLRRLGGNKMKTAKILGVSRPKLDSLLKS